MPLRPFPLPYSIGTDICHTPRFKKFIKDPDCQQKFLRFFDKVFVANEQNAFWERFGEYKGFCFSDGRNGGRSLGVVTWIAGRWAAKEAIIKSHAPNSRLHFRDIEIRYHPTRQPYGVVLDKATMEKFTVLEKRPGYISAEQIYNSWRESRDAKVGDGMNDTSTEQMSTKQRERKETPRILSEDGILDLGAVERALEIDTKDEEALSSTSTSSTPASSTAFPTLNTMRTGDPSSKSRSSPSKITLEPTKASTHTNGQTTISDIQPSTTSTQQPQHQHQHPILEFPDARAQNHPSQSQPQQTQEPNQEASHQEGRQEQEENIDGQIVQLSISHDGEYCVAVAMSPILNPSLQGKMRLDETRAKFDQADMDRLRRTVGTDHREKL